MASSSNQGPQAVVDVDMECDDELHFEGAANATAAEPDVFSCTDCTGKHPLYSYFCYLQPNNEFVDAQDINMQRAVDEAAGRDKVVNRFVSVEKRMVCVFCAGRLHNCLEKYVKAPSNKPTSFFLKQSRKSKGMVQSTKRAEKILTMHDQKMSRIDDDDGDDNTKPSALEVYKARKDVDFSKALDWVTQLSPETWLMYGCSKCVTYPLKSSNWFRAARGKAMDKDGMTTDSNKLGSWFCAKCGEEWGFAIGGEIRLLVFGTYTEQYGFTEYEYSMIGKVSALTENKMLFLKGCTALTELNQMKVSAITKEVLLEMVARLNEKVAKKFSRGIDEIAIVNSKDIKSDLEYRGMRLVCEDERLSMKSHGHAYKVIDLHDMEIPVIDQAEFDFILDVLAASLDVERRTDLKPAEKRIREGFVTSSVFKESRKMLQSRL
jgi:hypothetical protein